MNKLTLLLAILLALYSCSSQTNTQSSEVTIDGIKNKMEELLKMQDPSIKVFINKASNYIDISGVQIPYRYVVCTYEDDHVRHVPLAVMTCVAGTSCILFSDPNTAHVSGASYPFMSKEDAYKFIDLVKNLKDLSKER